MPSTVQIRRYSTDFAAFCDDVIIPTPLGKFRFGDKMHPNQRKLVAALAPSLAAIAAGRMPPTPKFWAEMVKGWGKDLIIGLAVLWLVMFALRPLLIHLGAAHQDQADGTHQLVCGILHCNPWLRARVETPNYRVTCKATDSTAEVLAADVSGSHGGRPDCLILNELHAVTKWQFIENLADNASKNPACLTIVATNAGFKSHPSWKWREIARTLPRWSFHQVCVPPPWTDPAEIEEAKRRNSTERVNRLWFGVWSMGGGDALDPVDIDAAIDPELQPLSGRAVQSGQGYSSHAMHPAAIPLHSSRPTPPASDPLRGLTLIAGLDLGIKHDHSALVVLATNHRTQRIRLAHAQSWAPARLTGKVDLEAVEQAVADAQVSYRLSAVYYDPFQAALMAQRLQKKGCKMVELPFVGQNLNRMATTLMETFRSRRIDLYPDERLAADLRRLSIMEKTYGYKLESTRDADGHADVATALAIALPAAVDAAASSYAPGDAIVVESNNHLPRGIYSTRF